ncbi:hypothetical protein [Endozoicomonas sp. SCSIO W0465]|uniref:hypothetical protein n=1 Tax=Endozoicomonas sp. SCSIO W0465 TaxID=2918516 RepID=UPI00207583A9|nr:hypothetical protein [Endozoicomonas sp. SCSIO W0465]USE37451.1 hypothetical protein MJO57_04300 [Endozoicomonas sp. SCSIO W0465]
MERTKKPASFINQNVLLPLLTEVILKKYLITMKVRKTLIFPLEHQNPENLTRHSLLYRAANWLESTMRALQEHRENENQAGAPAQQITQQRAACPSSGQYPFRRHLVKTRFFLPTRGRLPVCTNLKRSDPYQW